MAFAIAFELLLSQRRTALGDTPPAVRVNPVPESGPVPMEHPPPTATMEPETPTELAPTELAPAALAPAGPREPAVRAPEPEPEPVPVAPPAGVDLPSRIAALVAAAQAAGQTPPGRRRLAEALGVTEHAIRTATVRNGAAPEGAPR